MMAPTVVGCFFGAGAAGQWPRMARVLAYTIRRHLPTWVSRVEMLPPPSAGLDDGYHANTTKLDYWAAQVAAAPDGSRLLLLDVDTAILRPLDDIWDRPFDVGYTTKPARYPINAGVVFVRVSPATRTWMAAWRDENRRMLVTPQHHRIWRQKFSGINQAALGSLLQQPISQTVQLQELPCVEWNCESASWERFDPAVTRILHVKSGLRRAVFGLGTTSPACRDLSRLWQRLERDAIAEAA